MTTFLATQVLKTLRPDVTDRIVGVWRSRYGHIAVTADGGEFCLVTGCYDGSHCEAYAKLRGIDAK